MVQPQFLHRIRHAARLERIQRLRAAGGDIAKGSAPFADLAHDHHGGVALAPAFAGIGAAGLFAYCHQLVFAHDITGAFVALGSGGFYANPVGLARLGVIGLVRLFRVALLGTFEITQGGVPIAKNLAPF